MEKINFVNGTSPALNATNLNKLQDNIENAIKTKQDKIEDSGWIDITPLMGTANTSNYYKPQYRKIGNRVTMRGQIQGVNKRSENIFTLPEGFYNPTRRLSFSTTNDYCHVNMVRVVNTGGVILQRSTGVFEDGIDIMLDDISFYID